MVNKPPRVIRLVKMSSCKSAGLSYTLDPAFWGQGFATEAVRCGLHYSRDILRLSYVISAIQPQNARSRRVAQRCGAHAGLQMG
jgi:RimJ/RimL family protein N-acetyltransferase